MSGAWQLKMTKGGLVLWIKALPCCPNPFPITRNYFSSVNVVEVTKSLIICKKNDVKSFILSCTFFLNTLIVYCCRLFQYQVEPNQPNSQAVRIFRQTYQSHYTVRGLQRNYGLFYFLLLLQELFVRLPYFSLFLYREIIHWTIASLVVFFTPLIFNWLHTVHRSFDLMSWCW